MAHNPKATCSFIFAKSFAVILTFLFACGAGQQAAEFDKNPTWITIGWICSLIFEIFLLFVLIFEFRILIIGGGMVLYALESIFIFLIFMNVMNGVRRYLRTQIIRYRITTEEAQNIILILGGIFMLGSFIHFVRFCCLMFVYTRIRRAMTEESNEKSPLP